MAKRSIQQKKLRKLRKALRRTPTAYIDLVQWLKDRRYVSTAGQARQLIVQGKVKSDSHAIGREQQPRMGANGKPEMAWVAAPLVPASLRGTIRVEDS